MDVCWSPVKCARVGSDLAKLTVWGQNESCDSFRRHGRSTSVSGPAGPAVGTSGSGQLRTRALQERWSSLGDGFARCREYRLTMLVVGEHREALFVLLIFAPEPTHSTNQTADGINTNPHKS